MLRACISLFTFDQLVSIYLRGSPFSPFSDLVLYFTFTGSYKNVANNGNDHNIFIHFIVNSFEQKRYLHKLNIYAQAICFGIFAQVVKPVEVVYKYKRILQFLADII